MTTGSAYDASGNLTSWNANTYEWDALDMMRRYRTAAGDEWTYLYSADEERIATVKTGNSDIRWTLRGFDQKVLRDYQAAGGAWSILNDYIYRGSQLLAVETPTGVRHFSLDDLGTPRLVTNASGIKAAYHVYYPFGQEASAIAQDSERMKFTGHERDLGNLTSAADDLDYMYARFESPLTGRFLSFGPVLNLKKVSGLPQSWNRFTYVRGSPIRFTDPSGRCIEDACVGEAIVGAVVLAAETPAGQEAIAAGEAELAAASQEATVLAGEALTYAQRLAQNAELGKLGERLAGIVEFEKLRLNR